MAILPNPGPSFRKMMRLWRLFAQSNVFVPAMALFGLLLVILAGQTFLNQTNNRVGGEVITAISKNDANRYYKLVSQYILFFLLLTAANITFRFFEEQLALLLRKGLTTHLIESYLGNRSYLRLIDQPEVDNPDQRITEDVKTLTTNALSFLLLVIRACVNFYVFSSILSTITPTLVWSAAAYAGLGSVMTLIIGKKLVGLNFDQLHKEADLRYELMRTRDHAEAIALQHDEGRQGPRLIDRLWRVIMNTRRIIVRNAFLGLFTTAYGYLIVVVPILIVAPKCLFEREELGTIFRAQEGFRYVVDALSVLVTEFPRLALLAAGIARLGELTAAIAAPPRKNGLHVEINGDLLAAKNLTLVDPTDGHRFFAGVEFEILPTEHTLIVGRPGSGKSELTRAIAGLWPTGLGTIIRPPFDHVAFVTPQPYLTPSSLRQIMSPDPANAITSDMELLDALAAVGLQAIVERAGGLDRERDWDAQLSLSERQALALARLLLAKPKFAVLDEATGGLEREMRKSYYDKLSAAGITVVTLSARRIFPEFHKQQIILPGGSSTQTGNTAA